MTTTCMAAMAAAVLAVQSQAGLDEEYFSHFSVSSYEVPERVLKSAESFFLEGEFTIQPEESGGITSLQPYLEEELVSNGIGFITLDVTTHGSTGGRLRMTFPALPSGVGSRTVVLETGTGTHTIVQTRPQALTYTLDPPGPKYPGDGQAITVTGGTAGAKYFLYHGGSLMAGTETVCDGGPMTFGPYSDTGEYRLYNEETGYTATAAEISDYDIFMPDGGISADDAMSMPLMLPSQGGAVTLELHSYEVIDREPYAAIAKRMNSEGVRGCWEPGDGISIAFDVKDAHTLELTFLCSPNFSSEPRRNDTGFHVDDLGRPESTIVGDAGREALSHNLQGWRTGTADTFFGDSVFTQTIGYYTPVTMDANPSYGGRISGIRTGRAVAGAVRDESYSYDGFGRLAGTSSLADGRLRYEARVPRSGEGAVYEYDYNILGLMEKAMKDYTDLVEYSYLSDGTRTETKMSDGTSLKYRGSFVFRTGTDGRTELEGIAYDGGRLVAENRGGEPRRRDCPPARPLARARPSRQRPRRGGHKRGRRGR